MTETTAITQTPSVSAEIVSKFKAASSAVSDQFVGRDETVRAIYAAMVAGQHVFMLGPPGTGKSALSRSIASTVSARTFDYLFGRTTTPDEVFGALDLQALKMGRYERITAGKLPDCEVAFCDEAGKANSTVLNGMLTAMNERMYDAGRGFEPIPLRIMLAASNELPDPKETGAFLDRFAVKLYVDEGSTGRSDWESIVNGQKKAGKVEALVSLDELDLAQFEAGEVDPTGAVDALWKIKSDLEQREITHTARKWKAIVSLCKAVAWLDGRDKTVAKDAAIAEHCLWRFPKERDAVQEVVADHCAGSEAEANRLAKGAREIMGRLSDTSSFDEITRAVREVSHVVKQINAMGEADCDPIAAQLEAEVDSHKRKALAQLGL